MVELKIIKKIQDAISNENILDMLDGDVLPKKTITDYEDYFKDLKYTLLGNGALFLVNDSTNEIRQHYDNTYQKTINYDKFIKSQESKQNYFDNKNIQYELFVVPDKSILLQEKLPFKTNYPKRHIDYLLDVACDLLEVLDEKDTDVTDTLINREAGIKITAFILSRLHDEEDSDYYLEQLFNRLNIETIDNYKGDLLSDKNWSYTDDKELKEELHISTKNVTLIEDKTINLKEEIPEEFKICNTRASEHIKNPKSMTDKKLLILGDASSQRVIIPLEAYYGEVFYYNDCRYFNEDLINWYKPDDVIEIITERYLDTAYCPIINEEVIQLPVIDDINMEIKNGKLNINARFNDLRNIPAKGVCMLYINKQLVDQRDTDGTYTKQYTLENFGDKIEVVLKLKSGISTKKNVVVYKKYIRPTKI
ncbi:hypothetical protein [Methanosphaera sp. WGK6]|uniref:hypothetical protein n=1 Tax=Methanosphaera sp. WGK6 TaxID=1561964 RepID=UPI00084C5FD1|nr:hypothetical protein [Methanosphaera sp. WGK6]OED29915.1 hypothetical protein NL43_05765 [Methanosphaera sp. WGK6]